VQLATIETKPLYRMRFSYPHGWRVRLGASEDADAQYFFLAEGRCDGAIAGAFRGANHPLQRSDGTFLPNFQGVIETDDGAEILVDQRGYGRGYPAGRRQIVVTATHLSEHERYRWLNDVVTVGVGEVRAREGQGPELVIDWAEVLWSPVPD
jgi:hypothetical protein